jgi:hypothetical protein
MTGQTRHVPGSEASGGMVQWSPLLDVRNTGVDIVSRAIGSLTEADGLMEAACKFAQGIRALLVDPRVGLTSAMADSGFAALPAAERAGVHAALGRYFVAFFAYGIGESVRFADDPNLPYQKAFDRFMVTVEELAETPVPTDRFDRFLRGLTILRKTGEVAMFTSDNGGYIQFDGFGRALAPADQDRLKVLGFDVSPDGRSCTFDD